jgi:uncharacterized repeat protein (TIGR01451 family)
LATSASNLPTLASQVTVGPGQQITLTFPAQVKPEVANGTTIVNTASASSTEATIPVSDGVSLGVNFPVLGIRKQVNDIIPQAGQTVTYTLVISNSGEIAATNTVISDTLSNNLIFVGPVKLEPPQPGAILATSAGNLPTLASGVTVGPGQQITLTVPVQVKPEVADDTTIVNTASASSEKVVGYVSDVVELTVTAKKINVYLPVVSSCKSALPVFVCLGP